MPRVFIALLIGISLSLTLARDPSENDNLFEGDMVLTRGQRLAIDLATAGLPTFAASTFKNWPNHVVPYQIHGSLNQEKYAKKAIHDAMDDYRKHTCLKFRPRKREDMSYIHFVPGYGCSSPVGYGRGERRIILAPGCWKKGIVIHEIMHSLGFFHEQSRPDRDSYVTIKWENIPSGKRHNFMKYGTRVINSFRSPYDYNSIMHYGPRAFGSGKTTIETKRNALIGQRKGLSKQDIAQIKIKYRC